MGRVARQLLDRAPIEIAGAEIHLAIAAPGAKRGIDEADLLEQGRPVDRRDQAHAGDDVAHRDIRCALALMLLPNDLVGGRPLGRQPLVQPEQGRCRLGILVAQPLNQLGGKGRRQGHRSEIAEDGRRRFGLCPIHPQEAVDRKIGRLAGLAPGHDPLGRAAKILHQHDAQGDGDRPELADQERLHPLIGSDEPAEHLLVETAVRMGDEGPGQAEDSRDSRPAVPRRAWAARDRSAAEDRA